ncbi:sensor histidine kinase [Bacteroides sp. UBA939]|uniref:sensor histidine kinase n=1 Tax=Bacteroides sp. UBA939 TaxID=1946092 RepID=UPI0025BE0E23|nr:HAMP domain-containing sensor histidine kinase [Bacteroides sp. UBA939]
MKLPFRLIATLVITSLLGIFAYQAYWLTGLYRTMKRDLEQSIVEAMRMSDYKEMMLRIERMREANEQHGEVNVSAGYESDTGKTFVRSSTTVHQDTAADAAEPYASLRTDNGLNLMLRNRDTMAELAAFLQRGIHSGIDHLSDPDIAAYDSILTHLLREKGILIPHRLERLHTGANLDSTLVFTDTIALAGDSTYLPGKQAKQYNYTFDIHSHQSYRLTMEPIDHIILRQMSGILATSLIILLILSLSFWFLIHTILRQKTLEEMKSDFTNNITHELKTPIAVAYAANDALLNFNLAADPQQRNKYLTICQQQLQRLSRLVEQILSMSMERRETFRLHPEALPLCDLFPPLIEQHKLKAGKPVEVRLHIRPQDLTVTADRTHFSNILSNLIDNAIKYSPVAADIEIRCCRTEASCLKTEAGCLKTEANCLKAEASYPKAEASQVEISVTDHGTGIPADKQSLIFDKFYRIPTGNLHDTKGYGLGLFYVKTMIDRHNGTVTVNSVPGKGSTFTIRI